MTHTARKRRFKKRKDKNIKYIWDLIGNTGPLFTYEDVIGFLHKVSNFFEDNNIEEVKVNTNPFGIEIIKKENENKPYPPGTLYGLAKRLNLKE